MKRISIVLICLISSIASADNYLEAVGGSITYHVIDDGATQDYVTRWSPDGRLIFNNLYGVRFVSENVYTYEAYAFFGGNNSIGSPINGVLASWGFIIGHFDIGVAVGGYLQDDGAFERDNLEPFILTEIGNEGVVPIFGAEIDYRVNLSDNVYLKLNNIISPVITNTTLSVGYKL